MQMKTYLLRHLVWPAVVMLFTLSTPDAQAQSARIRGFVTDLADGQTLQGVNVFLRDMEANLVTGSATDGNGYYDLPQITPGRYVLLASFIGYAPYADTLDVAAGDLITRNIEISVSEAELDEVVIESERETGAAALSAGLQTVRVNEIERIPTPDVSGDLAGYLQTLPGVVSTGDRGGQLFIRGGTATQNMSLIDGMVLYQPFHIVGFYSAFPSDIINKVDIYAGGYGARFGGRLSSVIDVSTRDGNKQRFQGSLSLAPFLTAAQLEGPLWRGRVSMLLSARESFIEETGPQLLNQELPYRFGDRFGKIHVLIGKSSRLSLTGIQTFDRGRIDPFEEDVDLFFDEENTEDVIPNSDEVAWVNEAYGMRYLVLPATIPVLAELVFSYSTLKNRFGNEDKPERESDVSEFNATVNMSYFLRDVDLLFGFFLRGSNLSHKLGGQFQDFDDSNEYLTEAGGFSEAAIKVLPSLTVTPGLRLHSFPSVGGVSLEPRLKAIWQPAGEDGRHRLSAAWGIYRQEIVGLQDRRDAGNVFTAWSPTPLAQEIPRAIHYIAGYQFRPTRILEFSIEGFYKELANLVVPEWSAFPAFSTRLQSATGSVYGADARVELNTPRFYGFLSYGYTAVEYVAQQSSLQLWYGQEEYQYPPPHDRRHQVNALATLSMFDFDLSVRWQFGSGLPFSQAVGFDNWIALVDSKVDVKTAQGHARVIYGPPYRGRLPTYHRLDISLERTFRPSRNIGLTVQGALINGYDRTNLFYLDLFTLRRVDQLPLIPSFGLKFEFN